MLIDTHCHIQDREFAGDLEAVLGRAREAGVAYALVVGSDLASSQRAFNLAQRFPQLFAAVGSIPMTARMPIVPPLTGSGNWSPKTGWWPWEKWAWTTTTIFPRKNQQRVFRYQIGLARELGLPIIIHDREAHGDT